MPAPLSEAVTSAGCGGFQTLDGDKLKTDLTLYVEPLVHELMVLLVR